MKNLLKSSFILLAVASMTFLASCGDEEDPLPDAPIIEVTADAEVAEGDPIELTIAITAAGGFDRFTITEGTNNFIGEYDAEDFQDVEDGAVTAFTQLISLTGNATAGTTLDFTVLVVDKENQTASDVVSVDIVEPASPVAKVQTTVLLYAPTGDGASASFYSIDDDMTYSIDDVDATTDPVSSGIEIGYYYGAEANLVAPSVFLDFTNLEGEYSDPTHGLPAWGTRNSTKMVKLTGVSVTETTTVAEVEAAIADVDFDAASNYVEGVLANDMYAFESSTGYSGLIRVVALEPGFESNDYITLEFILTTAE